MQPRLILAFLLILISFLPSCDERQIQLETTDWNEPPYCRSEDVRTRVLQFQLDRADFVFSATIKDIVHSPREWIEGFAMKYPTVTYSINEVILGRTNKKVVQAVVWEPLVKGVSRIGRSDLDCTLQMLPGEYTLNSDIYAPGRKHIVFVDITNIGKTDLIRFELIGVQPFTPRNFREIANMIKSHTTSQNN